MDKFVNLHVHSTYSFIDGYGTPKQYFDAAEKLGQTALAVTDHGNISSHFKWYKEGVKSKIKPILGCEMYVVDNLEEKTKRSYNHITVIALNNIGYRNLLQLVTDSWLKGFYYKPRTDWNQLALHKEGLMFTSGCMSSKAGELIKSGKTIIEICNEIRKQKQLLGNYYIEVTPLSFADGKKYVQMMVSAAKIEKIPLLATSDCHYPEPHQSKIQEIMLCIQSNDSMLRSAPPRWKFDQDDFYLKSRKQMEDDFKMNYPDLDFTEALDNTVKVAEIVDFTFPVAKPLEFPMSQEEKIKQFKDLCWKGMLQRGFENKKEYVDRAKYEIDLIIKKDFVDYFMVIADLVSFAKSNNILVGPARGSAAGSLVCYLTRITEVDPMVHGLIFERFIDINREDVPDIDIDFEDEKRHLVKEYLSKKYGEDKVGDIATFAMFKGKNSISDLGRVYKIPIDVCEKIKNLLVVRSGGDSRASFTIEDTFEQFEYPKEALKKYPELKYASAFEGQIRQFGKHAAGVVISNESLQNVCAFYQRGGEKVISMDYYDASSSGLLKIDVLGLRTLTFLHKAADLVGQRHNKIIDYYKLSLDDPKVYEMFNDPERLFGIFQFDGQAVNQVCRQVRPQNFSELSDIDALARPGPLNSGATTAYIMRKNGKEKVVYAHPLLEPITKDTQGIIIYQEQVMRVMREIGLMSWKDTAEIRKNISKSRGLEAFNEYKERFAVGAIKNGLSEKEINQIWDSVCTFGSWAFNKSHSVSYTYISYWTMWMKVHYPIEYYSAILATSYNDGTTRKVIKEYRREGYKILPIDINRSKETFSIDGEGIRLGFKQLRGIGEKTNQTLVLNQPYRNYADFKEKIYKKRVSSKIVSILEKMGAFESTGGIREELTLFNQNPGVVEWHLPKIEELIVLCPYSVELSIENDWRDFIDKYIIRKPTRIADLVIHSEETGINPWDQPTKFIMGVAYDKSPRDKREVAASKGLHVTFQEGELTEFLNMTVEDDSDFITVRIPVKIYPQYKTKIFEEVKDSDVLYIAGKIGSGIRMFFLTDFVILRTLKEKIEKGKMLTPIEKLFVKPSVNKFVNI